MIKKILILIMITITLIGVNGCMKKDKNNEKTIKVSKEEAEEMMLKYMEDKYKEEFEVVSFGGESWAAKYSSMTVKPLKFPNRTTEVIMYGNGEINDSYIGYYMKEKIEKLMDEIIKDIYPESKIFYTVTGKPLGDSVNPDMTPAEFNKATGSPMSCNMFVYDAEYKKNKEIKLEEIRKKLEENKLRCESFIFYMKKDKLDLINNDNWRDILNFPGAVEYSELKCNFYMNEDYTFEWADWEEIDE